MTINPTVLNDKSDRRYANILGIKIDSTTSEGVLRQIRYFLSRKQKFFLATPNPEQFLLAWKNPDFASILGQCDLCLPDGVGLLAAHKLTSNTKNISFLSWLKEFYIHSWRRENIRRGLYLIKGRELFSDLITASSRLNWRVFLLGSTENIAQQAALRLRRNYPKLIIAAEAGPLLNDWAKPQDKQQEELERKSITAINRFRPDLLFVGFGAPKQERWVAAHLKELQVGGVMVVGRTFEYFAGRFRFPPKLFERLGIEWLFRLLTGSTDIKRIFKAVFVFPYEVYKRIR